MMAHENAGAPVVDPSSTMVRRSDQRRPPSRQGSNDSSVSSMNRKLRGLRRNRSGEQRIRPSGHHHRGVSGVRDAVVVGTNTTTVGSVSLIRNGSDDDSSVKYRPKSPQDRGDVQSKKMDDNRSLTSADSGISSKHSGSSLGGADGGEGYAVYEKKLTPVDKSSFSRQSLVSASEGSRSTTTMGSSTGNSSSDNNTGITADAVVVVADNPEHHHAASSSLGLSPHRQHHHQRGLGSSSRRGAGVIVNSGGSNLPLDGPSDHSNSNLSVASTVALERVAQRRGQLLAPGADGSTSGRARTRGLGSTRRQISTARVVEPSGAVPMVSNLGIVAPLSPKNTNTRGGSSTMSITSRSSSVTTIRGSSTRGGTGGGIGTRFSSINIPPVLPKGGAATAPPPTTTTPAATATAAIGSSAVQQQQRRSNNNDVPPIIVNKCKCFVKWGKQSIMIMMDPDEPLLNFRMQLEEATGVPRNEQRYTWCGSLKPFADDKTLRYYGCQGGGFFYLKRGPPPPNSSINNGNNNSGNNNNSPMMAMTTTTTTMMSSSNRPIPVPQEISPSHKSGGHFVEEYDDNNLMVTAENPHHSPRHHQQQQQQQQRQQHQLSRLTNLQSMMNTMNVNSSSNHSGNHSNHTTSSSRPGLRGRREVSDEVNFHNNTGSHHSTAASSYVSTSTSTTTRSRTPPRNTPSSSSSVLPMHVQQAQEQAEALATGGVATTPTAMPAVAAVPPPGAAPAPAPAIDPATAGPLYQPTERDWAVLYNRHVQELERKDLEIAMKLSTRRTSLPGTAEQGGPALFHDVDAAAAAALEAEAAGGGGSTADVNGMELALEVSRREASDNETNQNKEEQMLQLVLEMSRNDELGTSFDTSFVRDVDNGGTNNTDVGGGGENNNDIVPPYPSQQAKGPDDDDDDHDSELERALQLSAQQPQQQQQQQQALSEEEELERILKLSQEEAGQQTDDDEDEELRRVLEMSQEDMAAQEGQNDDDDEELRRILALSQQEATDIDKERETMELVLKLSQMGEL